MTTKTKTTYMTCSRCGGSGLYGQIGFCFKCNGAGRYLRDTFTRAVGARGLFFGFTTVVNGRTIKSIGRAESMEAVVADLIEGTTVKEITEEQARKFFNRYGVSTEI